MSTALALSMLYEILVAESKYESRGIEYRGRLKTLYNQMLNELRAHSDFQIKFIKQTQNRFIESLADSVKVLDPTEIQPTDLELCYGIHQYVFPKIPDFNTLDAKFLTKWHKFYNALPGFTKHPERRSKKTKEKENYQMSKRRHNRDSDSSSESDESDVKSKEPVMITKEDFEEPRPKVKEPEKKEEEETPKAEEASGSQFDVIETEGHVKLPIVTNTEVEIIDDTIVFGLMDEEKMTDWVSTSSFDAYKELYEQMYLFDPTLMIMYKQNRDLKKGVPRKVGVEMTEVNEPMKEEKTDFLEKLGEMYRPNTDQNESSTSTSSSNMDDTGDEMIGTEDFYKKSEVHTLPGSHKVNTSENFDINSIFGNYYCPLTPKVGENGVAEEKQEEQASEKKGKMKIKRPRGRPKKRRKGVGSGDGVSNFYKPGMVDLATNGEEMSSSESASSQTPTRNGNVDKEEGTDLMNLRSYSTNFMEVESNYSCTNSGNFEVRCTARIKDPFATGIGKGKMDANMGVYQELQVVLKKLFSLKRKISGNCSVCSGWNLLHGIAQSFCEFCEDKLVNAEPELLLKIFEIRRYLLSSMYPVVGYKYETLNVFKDGELDENWKEMLKMQKVSIQSLIQVGASFPKASLHDARYLPSPLSLPLRICNTINTFQYPKSNFPMTPGGTTSAITNTNEKREFVTPVETPVKNTYTNGGLGAGNVNSANSSVNRTTTVSMYTDGFNVDSVGYKDNGDKRLQTYTLMDMVRYRRYHRAKTMNDFLEEIFVEFHRKYSDERSYRLVSNYINILKGGLLLSTHLTNPYNYPGPDELGQTKKGVDVVGEKEKPNYIERETRGKTKEKEREKMNAKIKVKKDKGKGHGKDKKGKGRELDKYKEMLRGRDKDSRENYFDESVSFILSKLPLDTDLIKQSFYHRGVYMTKLENIRNYSFIHIGKMFGFKEVVYNRVSSQSSSSSTLPSDTTPTSSSVTCESSATGNVNTDEVREVPGQGEMRDVEEDEQTDSFNSLEVNSNADVDEVFAYNWHELLYSSLQKRPYLKTTKENNTDLIDWIAKGCYGEVDGGIHTDPTTMNMNPKVNKELINLLHKYKLLQNMPRCILKNLINTGKVKIGFPTSLEMYVLNIPDSIMDCTMYGGVGKGFLYSLDTVVDSLSLLSTIIRIGTESDKRTRNTRMV